MRLRKNIICAYCGTRTTKFIDEADDLICARCSKAVKDKQKQSIKMKKDNPINEAIKHLDELFPNDAPHHIVFM